MRRRLKDEAPDGFIRTLREKMASKPISLNQLAERAGCSPPFLSRILNRQRGLPSDKTILKLADVLDIEPREALLIEAGRIPDGDFQTAMSKPHMAELLRAAGDLTEEDRHKVLTTIRGLALKHRRRMK